MAKIKAPNTQYTGISAGVPFVSGVGETDNPYLIEWFRSHGYKVEAPEVYACPVCGKEYKTEKGLADHMAKEHQDEDPGDGENENAGEE